MSDGSNNNNSGKGRWLTLIGGLAFLGYSLSRKSQPASGGTGATSGTPEPKQPEPPKTPPSPETTEEKTDAGDDFRKKKEPHKNRDEDKKRRTDGKGKNGKPKA